MAGVRALMGKTEEAAKIAVNGKAVGPDELPTELLKLLLYDDAGLSGFHETIFGTRKGEG